MVKDEDRKYIDAIIFRLNAEVTKVRKKIKSNELYGWKENEKTD